MPTLQLLRRLALCLSLATFASRWGVAADSPAPHKDEQKKKADATKTTTEAEQPVYGDTMVVTASRTEEEVAKAPVAITVVRSEELATSPADNYADLLRRVPGLNVVQMSARDITLTSRSATFSLATGELALLDGRSLYQDFFGFVLWDALPINFDEVKQIEVIRGPGSAMWGANALNGVVNIRTKSPRELVGTQVGFAAGEVGTYQAAALTAGVEGRLSHKISMSYFEQDAWPRDNQAPDGSPFPPEANFKNEGTKQPKLDARFDFDQDQDHAWSFSGGAARTSGIIQTGIGPFSIDPSTNVDYGKIDYRVRDLTLRGYVNITDGNAKNLLNGLDFKFKNQTLNLEASHQRTLAEKHLLVYGASVRYNHFDLSIAPGEDHRSELGSYLEDTYFVNDKLKLNAGTRLDWFDTIGANLSPRVGLILSPHPDHSLRVSYNRAYRAPSLVNNYLDTQIYNALALPTGPYVFPIKADGDPDLKEEKLDAFEVGYTGNLANRATLSVSVYRNEVKDNIDFAAVEFYGPTNPPPGWPLPPAVLALLPSPLPSRFMYRNIGKVVDKGVEVGFDLTVRQGVTATCNYAFHAEPKVSDNNPTIPLEVNIPPRHTFNVGTSMVHGRWLGSMSLSWTDKALWTDVLDARFHGWTDSYALINGSFGVMLLDDRMQLTIKGTNLADNKVKQHVFGDIIGRKVVGEVKLIFR